MSLFQEGGDWIAVFNGNTGRFVRFNISRSVESHVALYEEYGDIPGVTFQALDLGNDKYFFKEMSPDRNSQIRYLICDNERIVPESFSCLNKARLIPPNKMMGLISMRYHQLFVMMQRRYGFMKH